MITLLTLSRPLVVLDVETTGLLFDADRIVEIGLLTIYPADSCPCDDRAACPDCHGTGRRPPLEWRTLVDPRMPIKKNVHGITNDTIKSCRVCSELPGHRDHVTTTDSECHEFKPWPTFAQLAGRLARFLTSCDFAGKNVRFDLQFLAAEMKRANMPWDYKDAAIVDADAIERVIEPRDLSSLYRRRTGKEPQGAHQALDDVRMTAEVIEAQLKAWGGPTTPAEVHAALWGDWITNDGQFRFDKAGVPTIWFGKHRGLAMREVPGDYWDWILKADFGDEAKSLARKAKMGEFPERKA